MKLYLIRHGQTEWNIDGKIQGKTDIPLNHTGIHQAELLSKAMDQNPVTAVFSSPLKRACQTAEIVADRKKLPVILIDELREVDFGLWEGLTWETIEERFREDFIKWDQNPVKHTPTGGEKRESCKKRCAMAISRILNQAKGDVAIVAHGGILVFVVAFLLQNQKDKNEIIVKNASITTIEYRKETSEGKLLRLNDIRHLTQENGGKTNKYC